MSRESDAAERLRKVAQEIDTWRGDTSDAEELRAMARRVQEMRGEYCPPGIRNNENRRYLEFTVAVSSLNWVARDLEEADSKEAGAGWADAEDSAGGWDDAEVGGEA